MFQFGVQAGWRDLTSFQSSFASNVQTNWAGATVVYDATLESAAKALETSFAASGNRNVYKWCSSQNVGGGVQPGCNEMILVYL